MNWYYALNGTQQGPVSEQELSRLVAAGTIKADSLVWRDGLTDWQPLNTALPSALETVAADAPQIGGVAVPGAQKDLVVQQMREGVLGTVPGTVEYAGFWIRFVAKFVDGMILMIPQFVIQWAVESMTGVTMPNTLEEMLHLKPQQIELAIVLTVLSGLVSAAYTILLTARHGATWGKMALGLKVVTDDGGRISFWRATGRFFAEILSGMPTLWIGYVIAGFDSHHRALHDHVCSTRVIKNP